MKSQARLVFGAGILILLGSGPPSAQRHPDLGDPACMKKGDDHLRLASLAMPADGGYGSKELQDYHIRMANKWYLAARSPGVPIVPDEPPPVVKKVKQIEFMDPSDPACPQPKFSAEPTMWTPGPPDLRPGRGVIPRRRPGPP